MTTRVRVGDGTGEAVVERRLDDEFHILYPSGARRSVHRRNVASPGYATPAETELLQALDAAGDSGLRYPANHLRDAALYLTSIGFTVEDGPALLLTTKGRAALDRLEGR